MSSALAEHGPWVYVVLTLPGSWRRHGTAWNAYKKAGALWNDRLRKRLKRLYGRFRYVQTWESHRDGFPHLNVVLGGDDLIADVDARGYGPERVVRGPTGRERRTRVPRWRALWRELATETGFGPVVWVERLEDVEDAPERTTDGLAAYMVKLAHNLGASPAAELTGHTAKEQTPLAAPRGFRRLRTSHRLLPPRHSDPDWTGKLAKDGETWDWSTVERYQLEQARRTCTALELLERSRRTGLPLPPWACKLLKVDSPA